MKRTFSGLEKVMDDFHKYVGQVVIISPEKGDKIAKMASEISELYHTNRISLMPSSLENCPLDKLTEAIALANNLFDRIEELNSFATRG